MCLNRFPLPPEASPQTQRTKSQEKKHTCSPTACVCKARFHVVSGAWIIRKYISIMEEYLQMSIISWKVNFFLFSLKSPPHSNNFHFALQWDIIVAQADEWYSENCSLKYFWKEHVFSIVGVKRYRPQIQILSICLKVRQWQRTLKERHLLSLLLFMIPPFENLILECFSEKNLESKGRRHLF